MQRLSNQTLNQLPRSIRRPSYDRAHLRIGMAHLGVGAFHRCHQADYTEDVLEAGATGWGIVGINLRPPFLAGLLRPQNGLYSRTLRDGQASQTRVIGCLRKVIDAAEDVRDALSALASAEISITTITITEKGYCHVPATGALDEAHPDIVHDLRYPQSPRSAVGFLAAALDLRRLTHGKGMTLISCDNIPSNGLVLRQVVETMCRLRLPELANWVRENVTFPSTMVDRIVPAIEPADLCWVNEKLQVEDRAAVIGEPFRQWIIEDSFHGSRPSWEQAGATIARDVRPYELIKMRLLNAAQSAFAYWGALSGYRYTFEALSDPVLYGSVRRMLVDESASTVPLIPGMEPATYVRSALDRIGNSSIRHTTHQVATDGSQKIVQRLLNPLRDRLASGQRHDGLTIAIAGWIAYLLAATSRGGNRWKASDPWAHTISNISERNGSLADVVAEILALQPIFGSDLPREPLTAKLTSAVTGLLDPDPRRYLATVLEAVS